MLVAAVPRTTLTSLPRADSRALSIPKSKLPARVPTAKRLPLPRLPRVRLPAASVVPRVSTPLTARVATEPSVPRVRVLAVRSVAVEAPLLRLSAPAVTAVLALRLLTLTVPVIATAELPPMARLIVPSMSLLIAEVPLYVMELAEEAEMSPLQPLVSPAKVIEESAEMLRAPVPLTVPLKVVVVASVMFSSPLISILASTASAAKLPLTPLISTVELEPLARVSMSKPVTVAPLTSTVPVQPEPRLRLELRAVVPLPRS